MSIHCQSALTDALQSAKVICPLEDILLITLCAVTAGAEGWSDIRMYAEGHRTWFEEHCCLQHGIPVDDTIAHTISRIDPEQFQLCFVSWMQRIHEAR